MVKYNLCLQRRGRFYVNHPMQFGMQLWWFVFLNSLHTYRTYMRVVHTIHANAACIFNTPRKLFLLKISSFKILFYLLIPGKRWKILGFSYTPSLIVSSFFYTKAFNLSRLMRMILDGNKNYIHKVRIWLEKSQGASQIQCDCIRAEL